jgi:putative DNA primase/helicase
LVDTDSQKNAEVRSLLTPRGEVAAQHCTAILGISHLSKAGGAEAMMRVSGSLAFVAAARAAYLVAPDPNDKARRLFLPIKNNLAPDTGGLAYRIEGAYVNSSLGTVETSRVMWEPGPVTITADEVVQANAPPKTSALDEAKDWLQDSLALGPMPAAEIFKGASGAGISEKTARRASEALGIIPQKTGMKGGWMWSLPPKMANGSEDAQEKNSATFGESGHLRETGRIAEEEL